MASVSEVASPVHEGARAWRLVYQGWGGFQLMANPPVNLDGTLIFAIQGAGRFQVYLQHAGGTYTANTVTATPAWTVYRLALPAGGLVGVTELTFKETENAARTIILDSIAVEPASAPASTPTGTPAPPTATQAPASSPTRTPTPPAGGGALRIMPLGDSITEGVNGGYRDVLQSRLAAAVIAYDLVGPRSDGYANGPDKDHAGTPGFNTGDILREINGYLATYDPDVVLLMIGTNDLAWWTNALPSEIAANVATIIDRIEASGARVILATTPPISNANVPPTGRSRSAMLRDYNAALRALAAARGLTLVDVEAVLTLSNLYDGIHPDETAHDQLIAPLWAEALGA
jgi:lysophospholipase L1-like esterase